MADRITFSIEQTMEALNLSRNTVYLEIAAGRLRTYKVGRRRMVSRDALTQFVRDRESESNSAAA
jgi:excisionase family DNA binding protein